MTRRTPGMLSSQASMLSLRQQPMAFTTPTSAPEPDRSQSFESSDIEGQTSRHNPICESCVAKHFINADGNGWHPAEGLEVCALCRGTETKPEAFTKPFCDFLQENPTIFHTVDYFKTKLNKQGFEELSTRDSWTDKVQPGGKYWVTRNGSSLIAFTVGKAYKPGNGVAMIGGHIDALTAKLKPVSTKPNKAGYVQLGVAPYAGGLNATWWDRDLSIGGRVVVRDEETGKTKTRLVKLDWPIAKIPTLAPHFGVGMMGQNNKETQAVPIIGLEGSPHVSAEPLGPVGSFVNTQPPRLVQLVSKQLSIQNYGSIVNWELELYDSQPAQTGGMDREFIFGGRIDDKLCSWPALMALLGSSSNEDEGTIKLVALFDDEEIGSLLRQGARGNFLPLVVERAVEALNPKTYGPGVLGQTYAKSFLLSADVTHAGNPNFLGSYLDEHVPKLNVGVVICADSNGHMTTDAVSTAILQRVGELAGCHTQTFQIRNDSRSGGTIGPALSSMMGVRAADAGLPQLSMHSVRATTGALDPGLGVKFFKGFLDNFEKIDGEWH
ncbi:Fc.00g050010.m01.CDS01 [Cosmosporella sp. VM-42]